MPVTARFSRVPVLRASRLRAPAIVATGLAVLLGGCASKGEIDLSSGVGITSIRSACPSVGIPASTGDVTVFDPPASRDAAAIDITAVMTNVRSTCNDVGSDIQTDVTFDVRASRIRTGAARDVTLPYFIAIVRGGTAVTAKRIGQITLHFDAGQVRASASGRATSTIARSAATLPDDIRKKLTEKRKAGDDDAAVDPLSRPEIRQAVKSASFEALVGFQLTDEQLKYNATR